MAHERLQDLLLAQAPEPTTGNPVTSRDWGIARKIWFVYFRVFTLILDIFSCILGFNNRDRFIWGGKVQPRKPPIYDHGDQTCFHTWLDGDCLFLETAGCYPTRILSSCEILQ